VPSKTFSVSNIGSLASQLILSEPGGEVIGISTRGVYLGLETDWVLFLTREGMRGPLTLNIQGFEPGIVHIVPGTPAKTSADWIWFKSTEVLLSTKAASIWKAPTPGQPVSEGSQPRVRLTEIARKLQSGGLTSEIGALLPEIAGIKVASGSNTSKAHTLIERLRSATVQGGTRDITDAIDALLGWGPGLTPSGDDLALGFLFVINRWGRQLAPGLDVKALNREITSSAYKKTTRLSANLIECASQGQASEPLLLALDGVMTGKPDVSTCAALLANWGNTSGVDAFVGLALAMG